VFPLQRWAAILPLLHRTHNLHGLQQRAHYSGLFLFAVPRPFAGVCLLSNNLGLPELPAGFLPKHYDPSLLAVLLDGRVPDLPRQSNLSIVRRWVLPFELGLCQLFSRHGRVRYLSIRKRVSGLLGVSDPSEWALRGNDSDNFAALHRAVFKIKIRR
jgi:hypothetical protein